MKYILNFLILLLNKPNCILHLIQTHILSIKELDMGWQLFIELGMRDSKEHLFFKPDTHLLKGAIVTEVEKCRAIIFTSN